MKKLGYLLAISALLAISCQQTEKKKRTDNEELNKESRTVTENKAKIGKDLISIAQTLLLKNVSTQMQKGGPSSAVSFCNLKALPLLDSLSAYHGVEISRLTNKARNPQNAIQLLSDSLQFIDFEKAIMKRSPHLAELPEGTVFYSSILISMPTCLKCHGEIGKDIDAKTASTLAHLYPNDQATGYKMRDLRGFWKVKFN